MKRHVAALAMAVSVGIAAQATAQSPDEFLDAFNMRTADDLLRLCDRQPSEPHYAEARGFCLGFIEGGGHFHDKISQVPEVEPMVCANDATTLNDVVLVYLEFAKANPDHMNKNAMDVLIEAAAQKWPCEG